MNTAYPRCFQLSCPSPVPEVNIAQYDLTMESALVVTAVLDENDPLKSHVTIQVADEGAWLIRVWFAASATPTDQDTLTPPTEPGPSSFFKVTDVTGKSEFEVAGSGSWYLQAALCGKVFVSDTLIAHGVGE